MAKFTGKHLCGSLFVNKTVDRWPTTLLSKSFLVHYCEFSKIFNSTHFAEQLRRLASDIQCNILKKNHVCLFLSLNMYLFAGFLSGFDNYHKITVRDYVHVPKFWCTWRTWENTKKHMSGVIPFTYWFC